MVRIAGMVLIALGAFTTVPALSVLLVRAIDDTFRQSLDDPYGVVRILCLGIAALGASVSGIGGLMVWVGRTDRR